MDDDLELYEGINESAISAELLNLKEKLHSSEAIISNLKSDLEDAQYQIEKLLREKSILEKNISILYNTAKRELDRKSNEIETLQKNFKRKIIDTQLERNDFDKGECLNKRKDDSNRTMRGEENQVTLKHYFINATIKVWYNLKLLKISNMK